MACNYFRASFKTTLMKMKFLAFAMVATSVAIVSCKGDKGELGPEGPNGKNSLTRTLVEAAGGNCATGGAKIESGIDANGNGTLDDGEVAATQTRYICNGATGNNTLTKTTVEAAGGNCGTGGVKVEVGVDANKNGTLEAAEVASTQYICNGATGAQSLIRTTTEAAGGNCGTGGVKFETGIDANKNGTLEDNEVDATKTKYVCNGATGTANVYYSDWIVVNESKWVETDRQIYTAGYTDYNSWNSSTGYVVDNYTDTSITYQAEVPTPKVTQDILDKGVVFYYFKDMTAPSNGKIYPFQSWDGWSVGMTNRTTDWSNDSYFYFDNVGEGDIQKDKMVLSTEWRGSAAFYDATLNRNGQSRYHYSNGNAAKRIKYDELKPKTNFAIRYVVIPGGVTGKYVGVNFQNYEQVKKLLNIKD